LKDAGLVIDRPEGRWIYYSMNHEAIQEVTDLVACLTEPKLTSSNHRTRCR
jgi:ArsR family transcriptional regulator